MEEQEDEAEQDLTSKVAKWLQQQGYPLEMRTARELQSKNIWASLGHYEDAESGQLRETDVYARASREEEDGPTLDIWLALECKTSRRNPWVLFTDTVSPWTQRNLRTQRLCAPDDRRWLARATRSSTQSKLPIPLLQGYAPFGYAVARALNRNNEDFAFGAMMSVGKAAAGIQKSLSSEASFFGDRNHSVIVPVLVIDAPLLQCQLKDDGSIGLQEIDRGTVVWKYRLSPDHPPSTVIRIVTPSVLPQLADDLNLTADNLFATLKRQPQQ
ncbi:hypothetical protein ACFYO1_11605 [Nocardia sp. NPDC006044]|uniref:hypothetical protein n=1 Tax=Nocardia sp. NPDC006044 TaxID=3364306 RepID=UPI0036945BA1